MLCLDLTVCPVYYTLTAAAAACPACMCGCVCRSRNLLVPPERGHFVLGRELLRSKGIKSTTLAATHEKAEKGGVAQSAIS